MQVWITKWSVNQGVFLVNAKTTEDPDTIEVLPSVSGSLSYFLPKPFWHKTQEEAMAHANKLLKKAIVAAQKRLNKLKLSIWMEESPGKIVLTPNDEGEVA